MAGHYGENEVSRAARQGQITGAGGAWNLLAARVAGITDYRDGFAAAYPEIAAGREIAFTDIANAIAAFIAFEWRADDSPFDRYLRGEALMGGTARMGMELFYGKAGCGNCHAGRFQTDHDFHAMGVPQLGPGKGARFESGARDVGRMRVSGSPQDAYAFRTPSLRNVNGTAPYAHDGAYATLPGFLAAHLEPATAVANYRREQAILPELPDADDWRIQDDPEDRAAISRSVVSPAVKLTDTELTQILAFLEALTDEDSLSGRLGIPSAVPSGLPVDR